MINETNMSMLSVINYDSTSDYFSKVPLFHTLISPFLTDFDLQSLKVSKSMMKSIETVFKGSQRAYAILNSANRFAYLLAQRDPLTDSKSKWEILKRTRPKVNKKDPCQSLKVYFDQFWNHIKIHDGVKFLNKLGIQERSGPIHIPLLNPVIYQIRYELQQKIVTYQYSGSYQKAVMVCDMNYGGEEDDYKAQQVRILNDAIKQKIEEL
jgi:hypothetical protein